jgi:hypothetical protein
VSFTAELKFPSVGTDRALSRVPNLDPDREQVRDAHLRALEYDPHDVDAEGERVVRTHATDVEDGMKSAGNDMAARPRASVCHEEARSFVWFLTGRDQNAVSDCQSATVPVCHVPPGHVRTTVVISRASARAHSKTRGETHASLAFRGASARQEIWPG